MINKPPTLTIEDAYDATWLYIEKYYALTDSDDGAILAGDMMLMANNVPFDPAMGEDWLKALHSIKPNEDLDIKKTTLTIEEAYNSMIKFLEIYCSMGADDDFLEFTEDTKNKNPRVLTWQDWLNSVEEIIGQTPRIRPYFQLLPIEEK